MRVTAVVLAGRANEGPFRDLSPARWEALVPVAGRPMVARVVGALREAAGVDRVVVVGAPEVAEALPGDVEVVGPGASLVESLRRGLAAAGCGLRVQDAPPRAAEGDEAEGPPVLVSGSDIPLLRAEAVDRFLEACARAPAAVHYPIVPREACERRFPGARRTFVRLRDGAFTGGNLFLLAPRAVPPVLALLERFYAARKRPLRLARLLGPGILARFLLGALRVEDVERRFRSLAGVTGRAVVCPDPEVGMDVDKPEDLSLAEAVLREDGSRGGGSR